MMKSLKFHAHDHRTFWCDADITVTEEDVRAYCLEMIAYYGESWLAGNYRKALETCTQDKSAFIWQEVAWSKYAQLDFDNEADEEDESTYTIIEQEGWDDGEYIQADTADGQ